MRVILRDWRDARARVIVRSDVSADRLIDAIRGAGYSAETEDSSAFRQTMDDRYSPETASAFDLLVIGTGAAGTAAAIRAAELGRRVAIVEQGVVGGTCVNVGCIPSKVLVRAAQVAHLARSGRFNGITASDVTVDWSALIRQKDEIVQALRAEKYLAVLASYGDRVHLVRGRAKFVSDTTVVVDGPGISLSAPHTIVATGSRPRIVNIPGVDRVEVLTSTSLMALREQPSSLIILGGRSVALELGQALSRLGTRVTVLQRSGRILPDHEPSISMALTEALRAEGIDIVTGVNPVSLRQDQNDVVVTVHDSEGVEQEFRAQRVTMALGRVPNTEGLGLADVGVNLDAAGHIIVGPDMRTSSQHILAAGDVTTLPKSVYVAAASGRVAAENAVLRTTHELDLSTVPQVVFTDPQVASVALTEDEARRQGLEVQVAELPLRHVPRAITSGDTRGLIRIIVDAERRTILGAHVLAAEAGEIIQSVSIAIRMGHLHGLTVDEFREMLFPYLTMVEGLKLAALALDKDLSRMSCCAS